MATINRDELEGALTRLGELALERGESVELLLLGGAVMVLAFGERTSTRDVDAVILAPTDRSLIRSLCAQIGAEHGWPPDWLNDAAKGFVSSLALGRLLIDRPGIRAHMPTTEQLLSMKLCAWRDDVDVNDARRLLTELSGENRSVVWQRVEPFLQPGRELKARYAFDDLWESTHGVD